LRSGQVLPTLREAIAAADRRAPERFRVIQYSVGYDQVHVLVEAIDEQALSSGMSSLAIRIARSINALVGRRGRFWADRWYGRTLTSSRQVEAALVHVLRNDSHCTSFSADSAGGVVLPRSRSYLWQIVRRALEQRA
jgi:REP element-mobilizing transposase RayT